ncbi:MAG: hypothetical protein KAJ48_05850 [Elusimicrobiales bacterium]|nr:hypothetical protein [Elusimicrobiales bacterium]
MTHTKNLILSVNSQNLKTFFIKKIISNYKYWLAGVITREIRNNGQREGYEIRTLEGEKSVLASVKILSDISFNKYAVNRSALEDFALRAIKIAIEKEKIILIDEVGGITLLSDKFIEQVRLALSSRMPVLLVVRSGARTFLDTLSSMSETKVYNMEKDNYSEIEKKTDEWFEFWIKRINHDG